MQITEQVHFSPDLCISVEERKQSSMLLTIVCCVYGVQCFPSKVHVFMLSLKEGGYDEDRGQHLKLGLPESHTFMQNTHHVDTVTHSIHNHSLLFEIYIDYICGVSTSSLTQSITFAERSI